MSSEMSENASAPDLDEDEVVESAQDELDEIAERPDNADPAVRKARWAAAKEEFLERAISGKDISWPEMSAKYGFKVQTMRNRASLGKWYAEIEKRRAMREDILDKKLTERTTMALDQLNKDFATSEVEIRKRHAIIARGMQVRAVAKLKDIQPEHLSVKEAIALLQFGIIEERRALGLPDTYTGPAPDDDNMTAKFRTVADQVGGHKKVQHLGVALLKALQSPEFEAALQVQDVEIKKPSGLSDAQAAGLEATPTPVSPSLAAKAVNAVVGKPKIIVRKMPPKK